MKRRLVVVPTVDHPEPCAIELADGVMHLSSTVPPTRGDCPKERPCGHVRCGHHLWLEASEDRPGRRWGGRHPPSTLRAAWLDPETGERLERSKLPPTCTLDIADGGARTGPFVARVLGQRSQRRSEQIVKRAIRGLRRRKGMGE